jgi:hypothetical protein
MKGVELPINSLVIIVICLIVLLSVVAFYFFGWRPWSMTVTQESARNNACQMLAVMGCRAHPANISVSSFDADKDGNIDPLTSSIYITTISCSNPSDVNTFDSLWSLCVCYYNLPQTDGGVESCKTDICGCSR